MKETLSEPVTLLEGYLDNMKPILTNYLNIESLFELTSRHYKNKKVMLVGYLASTGLA